MLTVRLRGVLLLSILSLLPAPLVASTDEFDGHWTGHLSFRGADWPLRLHVSRTDEGPRATLDLPDLVMAWEPIPVSEGSDSLRIELPFGFESFNLRRVGDRIGANRKLDSGEMIELHLERSDPPPFAREEIRFSNGEVTLAGTLVRPADAGPHPAVVLVQGSGPQGRDSWSYRSWADFFVRRGFATLYYDKRGVGGSNGNWQGATLSNLADDLLAAIDALRARDDIGRIGLCGGSQGGWIAMLAASRSDDASFLVLRSTSAVTPAEQELHRVAYGMRAAGFSPEEIQDARAYLLLYFSVVHTGEGWPLLRDAGRRAQAEPWADWVDQPERRRDLRWWQDNHDFDPRPLLEALTIPALALYGGADTVVPPIENLEKLRSYYGGDAAKLIIEIFPGADHRGEVPPGTTPDGAWRFPRIAEGLLDTLGRWLDGRRGGEPD